MDIELFIKQRGLNPQEKLDNDTGGYWELKDLLEDFVECQNEGQALPLVDVNACLPNLQDLQHKHDLNNSTGWTSHPDDCYLEGVEETYKAIKKELSNKY